MQAVNVRRGGTNKAFGTKSATSHAASSSPLPRLHFLLLRMQKYRRASYITGFTVKASLVNNIMQFRRFFRLPTLESQVHRKFITTMKNVA